jgi:ATP-dependent Clp protease adaptor protein ClpS
LPGNLLQSFRLCGGGRFFFRRGSIALWHEQRKIATFRPKLVWPMRRTGTKIRALIETGRRWRQFLLAGKGPARGWMPLHGGYYLEGELLVVRDDASRLLRVWVASAGRAGARCGADLQVFAAPVTGAKDPRRDGDGGPGQGTVVITRPKTQIRHPSMYRVLLLNDDYTPMEFVVSVLRKYFNKGLEEATRIMRHVHQHGVGECGVFTYEIAETKVTQVMDHARKHQHPLQCIMEKK